MKFNSVTAEFFADRYGCPCVTVSVGKKRFKARLHPKSFVDLIHVITNRCIDAMDAVDIKDNSMSSPVLLRCKVRSPPFLAENGYEVRSVYFPGLRHETKVRRQFMNADMTGVYAKVTGLADDVYTIMLPETEYGGRVLFIRHDVNSRFVELMGRESEEIWKLFP